MSRRNNSFSHFGGKTYGLMCTYYQPFVWFNSLDENTFRIVVENAKRRAPEMMNTLFFYKDQQKNFEAGMSLTFCDYQAQMSLRCP